MESPDSLGKRGEPEVRAAERPATFGSDVAPKEGKTRGKKDGKHDSELANAGSSAVWRAWSFGRTISSSSNSRRARRPLSMQSVASAPVDLPLKQQGQVTPFGNTKRSDSSGSLTGTEAEEDLSSSSLDTGMLPAPPSLAGAGRGGEHSGTGGEEEEEEGDGLGEPPALPPLPTTRSEASGATEDDRAGLNGDKAVEREGPATPSGGIGDDSSRLAMQPPMQGTPAAEALAANAMVPAVRSRGMRAKKPKFKKLTRNLKKKKAKQRNFQGNVIKGEHEQYTLTIGMMLGIRVAVGRPQQMDDLTLMDFMQVDKYLFPPKGCNKAPHRTPPHHLSHDFKFKDYAPKIFHRIRQLFGIDSASYMLSVSGNYNYLEFMANSKSGQFFFYSHDGRFMIKTQTPEENKFLRKILPHYYQYVSMNPDTMLTRFYGMHRVKMRHLKRKVHFVIMHSVFDTKEKIYRIYDLKGSTVGRSSGPSKVRKEGVVYKDLDLVDDKVKFHLGTKKKLFMDQLRKDANFLASLNIMDYSLLIGIHDKTREESQKLDTSLAASTSRLGERGSSSQSTDLTVPPPLSPHRTSEGVEERDVASSSASVDASSGHKSPPPHDPPGAKRELSYDSSSVFDEAPSVELNTDNDQEGSEDDSDYDSESDSDDDIPPPPSIGGTTSQPNSHFSDRGGQGGAPPLVTEASTIATERRLTHRRDHGVQSRLPSGEKGPEVYFVGIIDILQQYNALKRIETFYKSFRYDSRQISAVPPKWYSERFAKFVDENTD